VVEFNASITLKNKRKFPCCKIDIADSPDAEIQLKSVPDDDDEQFQICSEHEPNSDLHIGQGDVNDEGYMDRMLVSGRRPLSVRPETYDSSAN
jgi:hypothetical protein